MKIVLNPSYAESEVGRVSFFQKVINEKMEGLEGGKILGVGSSQLELENPLKDVEFYSIDYVQGSEASKNFRLCNLNHEAIPFESNYFDVVVAGEVIEHIERPFEFIKECYRVLKNDGILLLSTPTPHYYIEILKDVFGIRTLDDKEHLNLFSKAHLMAYATSQGFELVDYKRYKFWIPYIKLMVLSVNTLPLFNYQQIFVFRKV